MISEVHAHAAGGVTSDVGHDRRREKKKRRKMLRQSPEPPPGVSGGGAGGGCLPEPPWAGSFYGGREVSENPHE